MEIENAHANEPNPTAIFSQRGAASIIIIGVLILLLGIGIDAYYSRRRSSQTQQSSLSPTTFYSIPSIQPLPSPVSKQISCEVDDKEFCNFLATIHSTIQAENFSNLVNYQKAEEVTCDDGARAAQGLPTFRSPNLCKNIPEGEKASGYPIGNNQSEYTIVTAREYVSKLNDYFAKYRPFHYIGSIVKDNKGYIVYTSKGKLLALPVKKFGSEWKAISVVLGFTSTDFTTVDPVILNYIE